jgi:hypothetical protein
MDGGGHNNPSQFSVSEFLKSINKQDGYRINKHIISKNAYYTKKYRFVRSPSYFEGPGGHQKA